jgi:hypothetical protein
VVKRRAAAVALACAACGAEPTAPAPSGSDAPRTACGRGIVVVATDYQSTNVALLDVSGGVRAPTFVSSATTEAALTAPLSGDVVAPTTPAADEIVLVDRFPASVLSFVEVRSARVRAQLDVATGFASNPQDYVAVGDHAYVSRYETNATPGARPFDGGGDVLVVEARGPSIQRRIDLAPAVATTPGYLPRPNRMVASDGRLYVLASAYDADFSDSAPSRLVVVDAARAEIEAVHLLDGLHGCGGLALAPAFDATGAPREARPIAVSCSGKFGGTSTPSITESGLAVLVDDGARAPRASLREVARYRASDVAGRPLGFSVVFAEALVAGQAVERLLVTALGQTASSGAAERPDALVEIDPGSGASRVLFESARPFDLGEAQCATLLDPSLDGADGCGLCFAADASRAVVHRLTASPEGFSPDAALVVDTAIGLPPRLLGRY